MAKQPSEIAAEGLSRAEAIDIATAAYLKDGSTGPFDIAGRMVDVGAAIEAHPPSREALADPDIKPGWKRTMVRTAIVLASAGTKDGERV